MPPPFQTTDSPSELQSDGELFGEVTAADREVARRAERVLYERHVRYLFGVVSRQRKRLLLLAGLSAEDLVQDTFQRAFERAASFKAEPGLDAERARRRTRAWLGRIAQNLLTDSLRQSREIPASPYLEQLSAAATDGPPSSSPHLAPIRRALSQLSDREQDVLRVTALYYKSEGSERLPNAVSAELGRRWGISNDNVRAIRSRALKKLRRAMADQQPQQPQEHATQ